MFEQYKALVDGFKLLTVLILIAVDVVLGILVALKTHTFAWSKLASFVNTDVFMLVGGYFVMGFAALVVPSLVPGLIATWVAIDVQLIADVVAKFKKLGGINQPPA